MSVLGLMRENIRSLEPYSCARDEVGSGMRIYLDANENYSPLISMEGINRYPDSSNMAVKMAIEKAMGIPASRLCIGNGSDELIDILIRIFCTPGSDRILVFPPTYGEYSVLAAVNGVKVCTCPLEKDFSFDMDTAIEAIRRLCPKLVFFCSPNNPTGNLISPDAIREVARVNAGITVVDQAYVDFAPEGELGVSDVDDNERLVVLRTLSKAWALAGARIGFMIASDEILAKANDVKYPYNVPLPSQRAAIEALSKTEEFQKRVDEIIENRNGLMGRLSTMKGVLSVVPSDANFFLARFEDPKHVYSELLKRGIVVRDRSSNLNCEGCLRFTVGSAEECAELVSALEEIL